jgi:hypothetical protein
LEERWIEMGLTFFCFRQGHKKSRAIDGAAFLLIMRDLFARGLPQRQEDQKVWRID